jgi:hypothetical protein
MTSPCCQHYRRLTSEGDFSPRIDADSMPMVRLFGALAGVIGGSLVTAAMYGGRRAGVLEKTLAEESEARMRNAAKPAARSALAPRDHKL